jgi:hypothetical protein
MSRNLLFWILAVLITLATAVYQRLTGPTHPMRGQAEFSSTKIDYTLLRSFSEGDAPVAITVTDQQVQGVLVYRRFNTSDLWIEIPMTRQGNQIQAALPRQPMAGKLEYHLRITCEGETINVPGDRNVIIRFKGEVSAAVLIPHIVLMFFAMLFSTRAGLEALKPGGKLNSYVYWSAGLLFAGGFIFGPLVEKAAFGAYWTGIPLGWDLTDNKTLIALIGWIIPVVLLARGKAARAWVVIAAVVLILVFSIPHSIMGSEYDYASGRVGTAGLRR